MNLDLIAATQFLIGFRAPILAALVALVVSWLITPYVRQVAIARGAIDDPKSDERRVHKDPNPRWGRRLPSMPESLLRCCSSCPSPIPRQLLSRPT